MEGCVFSADNLHGYQDCKLPGGIKTRMQIGLNNNEYRRKDCKLPSLSYP